MSVSKLDQDTVEEIPPGGSPGAPDKIPVSGTAGFIPVWRQRELIANKLLIDSGFRLIRVLPEFPEDDDESLSADAARQAWGGIVIQKRVGDMDCNVEPIK